MDSNSIPHFSGTPYPALGLKLLSCSGTDVKGTTVTTSLVVGPGCQACQESAAQLSGSCRLVVRKKERYGWLVLYS